jgi:hypothetical protein
MLWNHVASVLVLVALWPGTAGATPLSDWTSCDPAATKTTVCSATVTKCCTGAFAGNATAKAILIPLDRCHQPIAAAGIYGIPGSGPPGANGAWCVDSPAANAHGMFYAYGLVYRLMQNGIPVHWVINPTKDPGSQMAYQAAGAQTYIASDIDFWVLSASTPPPAAPSPLTALGAATSPIKRLDANLNVAATYSRKEFPVRGSAFLIAPQYRAAFEKFWNKQAPYSALSTTRVCGLSKTCYDFSDVSLYEVDPNAVFAWQDFTSPGPSFAWTAGLPVAMSVNYAAPKIARFGSALSLSWLKAANLGDPSSAACATGGAFSPSDAVYCPITAANISAGALINNSFGWAWIDDQNLSCPGNNAFFDSLRTFMTAVPFARTAGNVMFVESSVDSVEACTGRQVLGGNGSNTGLVPSGSATNETASSPFVVPYPSSLYAQTADLPFNFASGSLPWFAYSGGRTYATAFQGASSTLHRVITQEATATASNPTCSLRKATSACYKNGLAAGNDLGDVQAYARHLNDPINGIAFYTGGNDPLANAQWSQLRTILDALIATPGGTITQNPLIREVSRSTPIATTVGGTSAVVQGTYEHNFPWPVTRTFSVGADRATFRFPQLKGHLRARTASTITTSSDFGTSGIIFDAASKIPNPSYAGCAPFTGSCRTVFTTTQANTRHPTIHHLKQSEATTLGPIMAPALAAADQAILIQRVLAGDDSANPNVFVPALGGVDRSTVAVIEASPLTGSARNTMAYFGAADGMLHAVCASTGGACDVLGRELWAYIPRVNLSGLRLNNVRIDGSPRVLDVFGDFDSSGRRSFRTVLMFQTGSGNATLDGGTPAVYALDVTNPESPTVLWEYTLSDAAARGAYELGMGLTLAAGPALVGGTAKNLVFAQTNNGGTAGPGNVVTAIDIVTGAKVWQTGYRYPTPPRGIAPDAPVAATPIPAGAVGIDKQRNGTLSDLVYGDIYGQLWEVDPGTGASRYGTGPLFRFLGNFKALGAKPAIYDNGNSYYAVAVSGGYADPADTVWGTGVQQHAVSISLNTPVASAPLDETSASPHIKFKIDLGPNQKGYSQALIVGSQVMFTTDTSDVNSADYGTSGASATSTGTFYAFNLAGAATGSPVVLAGGASGLASAGTSVFAGGATATLKAATTNGSAGTSIDTVTTRVSRNLWMRTQ